MTASGLLKRLSSCLVADEKSERLIGDRAYDSALLAANAAVISGIFIFFAITSQSVVSNLFAIEAVRCSFGLGISPEQGEMAVAISGGLLIIPFAISSMLVLLRNDQYASLVATIGFGLMAVAASSILAVLAISYWRKSRAKSQV